MAKKIRIRHGSKVDALVEKNQNWMSDLNHDMQKRLRSELADLVYHGEKMHSLGARFQSTRTIDLGEEKAVLDASFGPRSLLKRIRDLWPF